MLSNVLQIGLLADYSTQAVERQRVLSYRGTATGP
jgi:hypothetical protein